MEVAGRGEVTEVHRSRSRFRNVVVVVVVVVVIAAVLAALVVVIVAVVIVVVVVAVAVVVVVVMVVVVVGAIPALRSNFMADVMKLNKCNDWQNLELVAVYTLLSTEPQNTDFYRPTRSNASVNIRR
ncbi:hypothetical protein ElyMa_002091400 [Elysia marginata]|uniref:Uncharacterized protein n=1 Tax=Elysia marginata TaxID=1093978 RepID=A0AAV4FEK0_9GAST|nr:hypothetical protein ElyMa_002091400 [Elysia marginata]